MDSAVESLRALISRIEYASPDFLTYNTSPTWDKLSVKCSVCCSGECMGLWLRFCVSHGSRLWSFTKHESQLAFLWVKLEAVITSHKHDIWGGRWSNGEETVKKHFTAMVLVQVVIVSFDWTVYTVHSIVQYCDALFADNICHVDLDYQRIFSIQLPDILDTWPSCLLPSASCGHDRHNSLSMDRCLCHLCRSVMSVMVKK